MIELPLEAVLELYRRVMEATGGKAGVHDLGGLESALAQPRMSFAGAELYPTLIEKAAALGFSLIKNHPFSDGNKRMGLATMDAFLRLNGLRIAGDADDLESAIVRVAAGELDRDDFTAWLRDRVVPRDD